MANKSRNSQNVFHNIEIDSTALEEDIELNNTRALWRAAIMQKLLDAASNSKKRSAYKSKIQAIQWLKCDSKDFTLVCFLADMSPSYVKSKAAAAMMRGCKWRDDRRIAKPLTI